MCPRQCVCSFIDGQLQPVLLQNIPAAHLV